MAAPELTLEIDVAAGPLRYADDRKRFEGAVSRLAGVREVRPVATQGTLYRIRVAYAAGTPLVDRLRALREYRVRVIARSTSVVQLLLESAL